MNDYVSPEEIMEQRRRALAHALVQRAILAHLFPEVPDDEAAIVRVVGNLRRRIKDAQFRVRLSSGEVFSRPLLEVPIELWAVEGAFIRDLPRDRQPPFLTFDDFTEEGQRRGTDEKS